MEESLVIHIVGEQVMEGSFGPTHSRGTGHGRIFRSYKHILEKLFQHSFLSPSKQYFLGLRS